MDIDEIVGKLTINEICSLVPPKTFSSAEYRRRADLKAAVSCLPDEMKAVIHAGAVAKQSARDATKREKRRQDVDMNQTRRVFRRIEENDSDDECNRDISKFMEVPCVDDKKDCYRAFRGATSDNALAMCVCVVCARELMRADGEERAILKIQNINELLRPSNPHAAQELWNGMALVVDRIRGEGKSGYGWICSECFRRILKNKMPKLSLANDMWIGNIPHQLRVLTIPEQLLIARHHPCCFVFKLYPKDHDHLPHPAHLQRGMSGNCSLYSLNTPAIVDMLEGHLMPRPGAVLASVLAITFIGSKKLPKKWLKSTFCVRRRLVYEALVWLQENNSLYADIEISKERLSSLPEDGVPTEILSIVRHEEDGTLAAKEQETYVPNACNDEGFAGHRTSQGGDYMDLDGETDTEDNDSSTEEADVIPLQFCGLTDTDLSNVSTNELMMYALANLDREGNEGGYVVRNRHPVTEFGRPRPGQDDDVDRRNPLMAAYPCLWPYGVGGIEADRQIPVSFGEHVRWALQYHDRRFRTHNSFPFVAFGIMQKREALGSARVQMRRRDFDAEAVALATLTIADLKEAEIEEAKKLPISNPKVRMLRKHVFAASGRVMGSDNSRATYRGQIWGTTLVLRPPSLWMTINPIDMHDPVVQVFAGEQIDMDNFLATAGPDSHHRGVNVARDPYAATKFFHFIIHTVLRTLFGVEVVGNRVHSKMGVLGRVSGYFGVIEAQGHGSLHIHMLLWLKHAPNAEEMHELLKSAEFRDRVVAYIRENIRAHLDGFGYDTICTMQRETELAYSRPADPDSSRWEAEMNDMERRLVRSQQIHTCKRSTCLKINKKGQWVCKRRAPWELSDEDSIDEFGRWKVKRTYGYINGYCPPILLTLKCNNDIKLLTNGKETKNAGWYSTGYQTKKQNKSFNMSALMAKTLMYHTENSAYLKDIREKNRLLVFRCFHAINREAELSAPQVVSYLMGWGDVIRSHNYVALYWSSLAAYLLKTCPSLQKGPQAEQDNAESQQDEVSEYEPPVVNTNNEETETVVLDINNRTGKIVARSQVNDYELRGNELETMCFFDFIIETYEEKLSAKDREQNGNAVVATERDTDDVTGEGLVIDDTCIGDEERGPGKRKRGRPLNQRSRYLPPHAKHLTHRRVVRSEGHNTLPSIVGPYFPRRDDKDRRSFYCASMLALLKPWRKISELKNEGDSWEDAFTQFTQTLPLATRDILSGIQYYYDCKSAADRESKKANDQEDSCADDQCREHWGRQAGLEDENEKENEACGEQVVLTEKDLESYEAMQVPWREEAHGYTAVEIAKLRHIFGSDSHTWDVTGSKVGIAVGGDRVKLQIWLDAMAKEVAEQNAALREDTNKENTGTRDVEAHQLVEDAGEEDGFRDLAGVESIANLMPGIDESLSAVDPDCLLKDQRRAYDIVDWHLQETLSGRCPPQLLMVMPGEGGVGKSKTIQTITDNFHSKGCGHILVKGAYTGIAASIINGKTLHMIAMIPLKEGQQSAQTLKKLEAWWAPKKYLIIDEMSMVSRTFFAKLSAIIGRAKTGNDVQGSDQPFGGVNVILVGDFHQFPPVATKKSAPLYWPCNPSKDTIEEIIGRQIYEQFTTVVRLKEQVRVTDPVWVDLLQHIRYGKCHEHHLNLLRQLIITDPGCPETDFGTPPWNQAVLVTPRHAVRRQWNNAAALEQCAMSQVQIFQSPAIDTINGRPLTLLEKFAAAGTKQRGGNSRKERAGLQNIVDLAIGIQVMVTFNVQTDLDIANGARGEITGIVLDEREGPISPEQSVVQLRYPPLYMLVKLGRTKASALEGLPDGVLPITPIMKTYTIYDAQGVKKTVTRYQVPITSAYAFTDYRAQGQTIHCTIVDIARPPTGELTPFNAYVALSRGHGRDNIRLLRDFDDRLFTQHPSEYLRLEDERLERLDAITEVWWNAKVASRRLDSHGLLIFT